MARLDRIGVVAYNGFSFPAPMQVSISGVAVPDSSGRTYKYLNWMLTVEGVYVSEDGPTDTDIGEAFDTRMEDLRCKLTAPAKELVLTDKGFGELVVNEGQVEGGATQVPSNYGGGGALDSMFGPKPNISRWEQVGSNRAIRMVWTCLVTIPECCTVPAYRLELAQFNYSISWNITEEGMTVRTISGLLEVPVTRAAAGNRIPPDSADAYRPEVQKSFPQLDQFHRTQTYSLSEDKRTLQFTITDTEIPSDNAYFPGMLRIDIQHDTNSSLEGGGLINWNHTISGSITTAPGVSKVFAWNAFFNVVFARIAFHEKGKAVQQKDNVKKKTKSRVLMITSLSIGEQVYGRRMTFSCSYAMLCDLQTIMAAGGFGQAVPGDWGEWKASLGIVQGIRGVADMQHFNNDDLIVDLCALPPLPPPETTPTPTEVPKSPGKNEDVPLIEYKKEKSWIHCENTFIYDTSHEVILHTPLPKNTSESQSATSALIEQGNSTYFNPIPGSLSTNDVSVRTQAVGKKRIIITMTGTASRLGNPVVIPELKKIGGLIPKLWGNPVCVSHIERDLQGRPIHISWWRKQYVVDTKPVIVIGDNFTKDNQVTGLPKDCTTWQ